MEVEELNRDQSPIERLTVPRIISHLEQVVRGLVPGSGAIVWGGVLANFIPGPQDVYVDYHNDARAPLLFISGAEDHLMPPSVQWSNARHYKSETVTQVKEFPGRAHLMLVQAGWEEVADSALEWATRHAAAHSRHPAACSASSQGITSRSLRRIVGKAVTGQCMSRRVLRRLIAHIRAD